jgi:hypothetical protein
MKLDMCERATSFGGRACEIDQIVCIWATRGERSVGTGSVYIGSENHNFTPLEGCSRATMGLQECGLDYRNTELKSRVT